MLWLTLKSRAGGREAIRDRLASGAFPAIVRRPNNMQVVQPTTRAVFHLLPSPNDSVCSGKPAGHLDAESRVAQ